MQAMAKRPTFVDFRLYRLAWLPALLAVVVLMFSLEGAPDAIDPVTPPGTFEPDRATREARQIVELAPERPPGSEGDAAVADLVAQRFREVVAGSTTEQQFSTSFEGDDVQLTNVLLTLPGDAESTIVVLAPRDAARGPGAASSAAATGILIELAHALGVAGHDKTLVLASTSGGAAGAGELLDALPESESVEAVIAISQPGAGQRRPPFVVSSSTSETSPSVQLVRTAELSVETQAQEKSDEPSALTQLARLAIPSGLGPQAPLIADGFDAVAISSAGERPLPASEDGLENLSPESVDAFGRAVQSTIGAVDVAPASLEHGPGTHLELADNLVPGWTLALLALTLLLPAGVAAVDGCARASRRRQPLAAGLSWAAARSLPLVGGLALVYLLALLGVVPRPPFPFDPGLYEAGGRAAVTFALAILAVAGGALLLRSLRLTARRAPSCALPGLGAIATVACLIVWLANPYLGLLLAPAAHAWLPATGDRPFRRGILVIAACVLALVPLLLALVAISNELELGGGAPWTLTLMVADGQIGFPVAAAGCFIGGAMLGTIALALRRREPVPADG
jgi:hypothetical protein